MDKRLLAVSAKKFYRSGLTPDDKIIYLGSQACRSMKGRATKKGTYYALDERYGILAVDINSLDDVTSSPDETDYKKYKVIADFIDKYKYNTNGCRIFIVDNRGGEIAAKVIKLYEFAASFYDKAMLGLGLSL